MDEDEWPDEDTYLEAMDAFELEANEAIRELAAKHFTTTFLRSHALVLGMYRPEDESERVHVLPPDGQSGFTTVGLLEHGKTWMLN